MALALPISFFMWIIFAGPDGQRLSNWDFFKAPIKFTSPGGRMNAEAVGSFSWLSTGSFINGEPTCSNPRTEFFAMECFSGWRPWV
jgi:hypothetical protein